MFETILGYKIASYVVMGALGGITYALVNKFGWKEKYGWIRRIALGCIVGVVIYVSGVPNHLTSYGISYFGIDALEAFLTKGQKKKEVE